jgi:hypothetical protein
MQGRIRIIEVFLDEDGFNKPEFIGGISKTQLINLRKRVDNTEFEATLIDKETAFVEVVERDDAKKEKDKTMLILSIFGILLTTAGIIFSFL